MVAIFTCIVFSTADAIHAQDFLHEAGNPTPETQEQTTPSQTPTQKPISAQAEPPWREVSWKKLPRNILQDQRDIWLFPTQLAHGHHWVPTLVIIGVTAGLLASDAHTSPYFRQTNFFHGFNNGASSTITATETAVIPLAIYAIGLKRKSSYTQQSALLAGEAVADSFVVYAAINSLTRRLRPLDIAPNGNFSDTFFKSNKLLTNSSFPSGHTIAVFSVATVLANRYKDHKWVPWVAYGFAALIGFSRVSLGEHFPSDVFLAGALGYAISHYVVLRGR
jgi:membrane-associated phospholipid phosphatase